MKNYIKIGIYCGILSIVFAAGSWFVDSITPLIISFVLFAVGAIIYAYVVDVEETEARREQSRKVHALKLMQDREAAEKAYRAAKIAAEIEKKYQGV